MKALFNKLIHLLIMPCSRAPMLIEQRSAGELSFLKRVRLDAHLSVCKWCAAYEKKVAEIDRLLTQKYLSKEKEDGFYDTEIQSFKDSLKKKMNS